MAIRVPASGFGFPSTQVPSSDPNVLDDYEEGKWIPVLTAATTPPTGVTYATQVGQYTKIGRLVTIGFRLELSSLGSGGVGNVLITGLPFSCPGAGSQLFFGTLYWEVITFTGYVNIIPVVVAPTSINFFKQPLTGGAANLLWSDLAAGSRLRSAIAYATEFTA